MSISTVHVPPRIFRRVPYETAVRFEFDRFRGFVEEHSADLSLGGMFVKTRTAPPVGTVVPIEFRLDDGYELIRGTGKVIWVREEDEGPHRPAGMGLRFLELTAGSRELIFKVVERRVKEGEPTFDLEDAPPDGAGRGGEEGDEAPVDSGELARPRWTAPPPLEGTDAGAGPPVPAGAVDERAAEDVSADEAASPAAETPEPWQVAAPWSASPTAPRWIATDAPPEEAPAAAADPDPDPETIFVPPPPVPASRRPSPPAALSAGVAARRRPWRNGRGLGAAVLVVAVLVAAAYLSRDRWLGAGATAEAGEGGPGSQVLLMPEELDPRARGRGPDVSAAPPSGEGGSSGTVPGMPGGGTGGTEGRPVLAEGALPAAADPSAAAASPTPELAARTVPAPAAEAPGAPPPAGSRAAPGPRRIVDLTWADHGGRTDFLIWADAPLDPAAVRHFAIGGGKPRLVLRIPGVEEPFAAGRVEVGGPLVERVRTGLHAERGPSELHVVFDLTGGSVRLAALDEAGGRLRVSLERETP